MVTDNHYRWDFIGLSTDNKPTPSDSQKVVNGSTFYCSDNSKLYIWYKNQWYERKPLGGGGGGGSYTAGEGIDITDDTISVDTTVIQEKLTAGNNITISDNTISATDTTYSNFVGTDGTAAGTAGLVPAPATTDAGKFLKADGTWDTAGGGSGPTVVQTTGTSTTDVMSQNAVTSMVYADPATQYKIKIGAGASSSEGDESIEIGHNSRATGSESVAIGHGAQSASSYSVAIGNGSATTNGTNSVAIGRSASAEGEANVCLGAWAKATNADQGIVQIGLNASLAPSKGYNNSYYRLISGVYDPQSAHDAATKGYVDPTTDSSAPTTATVGRIGQIFIDTTNAAAYMCVAVDTVTPSYTWKQITA